MDPFLFCLLVAAVVTRAPAALVDAYAAKKAADAGEWDFLTDRAARRDARAQRRAEWAERILARRRAKAAGTDPKRAGLGTLFADMYHGACEDAIDRRRAKREGRDGKSGGDHSSWWRRKVDGAWKRVEEWWRRRRAGGPAQGGEGPQPEGQPAPLPDDMDDLVETWRDEFDGEGLEHIRNRRCVWVYGKTYCGAPAAPEMIYCDPHCDEYDRQSDPADDYPDGETRPHGDTNPEPEPHHGRHTDDPNNNGGNPMTAPTGTPAIADVHTNDAARQAFDQMAEGAAKLAEAAALAEVARAQIAAAAMASADGMSATAFDAGAQAAVADINDIVQDDTLSKWSEAADQIGASAKAGNDSLEKYRDAEDVVANNNVDGRTLQTSAS